MRAMRTKKDAPIRKWRNSGRGRVLFPDIAELGVSKDGTKGDCAVYEDTPENWKQLVNAVGNYNRYNTPRFAGKHFVVRRETERGKHVICVQRIS